jgi:hypothetical protein
MAKPMADQNNTKASYSSVQTKLYEVIEIVTQDTDLKLEFIFLVF